MGDNIMDNRHELERQFNNNGFVFRYPLRGGLPNHNSTKPGMFEPKTALALIGYLIGIPSSVWAILDNMNNWKADLVWLLAALFWAFKLFRAIMKWRQEHKEKQIELDEKRKRYEKDIWQ